MAAVTLTPDEMNIQKVPISKLKPAKYNPRKDLKPGDPAYEKIKRSLNDFGYVDPIIWNEVTGNIVGGHQRFKVLKAEGAQEIMCVVVHIENPDDEKALNVVLNKATGDWEPVALADLLSELQANGYDLDSTGFDAAEVNDLFSNVHDRNVKDDGFDVDAAAEAEAFVLPSDVWMLGKHRLMCGDSTDAASVAILMNGEKANLCITDPPYNCSYEGGTGMTIMNDKWEDSQKFYQFLLDAFKNVYDNLVDGGAFYAFHAFRCVAAGTASDTGTYISAKATGTFSSVSNKNSMTLKVQYALSTSGAYSTAVTLTNGTASIIGNGSIDINYSFKVKFILSDQFNTIEKVLNVGTAAFTVFFRQGGNGVAIGKVSERANAVEINPDWDIYHGSTKLNGTVPISRGGTGATSASGARSNLGAVNKAGDTMTGNLNIQGTLYPSMLLKPTQSGQTNQTVFEGSYVGASSFAAWEDNTGNNRRMLEVRTKAYAASLDNAVMVRVCDGGTWGNYRIYHEGMETVIPLSKGGTGGTSAATARSKIGANNASNLTTGTLPAARLPFKIQYGQTSVTGVAWTTVALSGFTNTPTIVVSYAGNPTSSGIAVLKTGSESASSFQVCMAGSSGSGTRKVNWIAIGT